MIGTTCGGCLGFVLKFRRRSPWGRSSCSSPSGWLRCATSSASYGRWKTRPLLFFGSCHQFWTSLSCPTSRRSRWTCAGLAQCTRSRPRSWQHWICTSWRDRVIWSLGLTSMNPWWAWSPSTARRSSAQSWHRSTQRSSVMPGPLWSHQCDPKIPWLPPLGWSHPPQNARGRSANQFRGSHTSRGHRPKRLPPLVTSSSGPLSPRC